MNVTFKASSIEELGPYALAALRIVTALIFFLHGAQKIWGFPALPPFGLPEVYSLLWVGGIIEVIGGALIFFGLFTRPTAFILSGEMAVAYWMFHASRGFYPTQNGGEGAILYCFIFLLISCFGPGKFSLDAVIRARVLKSVSKEQEVSSMPDA